MPTLVQFDFPMKGPWGEYMAVAFRDLADIIGRAPGLQWKIWTENESEETGGGTPYVEIDGTTFECWNAPGGLREAVLAASGGPAPSDGGGEAAPSDGGEG